MRGPGRDLAEKENGDDSDKESSAKPCGLNLR
jgi:hypothetical protein